MTNIGVIMTFYGSINFAIYFYFLAHCSFTAENNQ